VAQYDMTNGHVAAEYEYDPYGKLVRTTGYTLSGTTWSMVSYDPTGCPFKYQTKWHLQDVSGVASDSGFTQFDIYDYGMRWYHPRLGRFINQDPIGVAGGSNLYGFCGNDPINGSDVLGMKPAEDWWISYQVGRGYQGPGSLEWELEGKSSGTEGYDSGDGFYHFTISSPSDLNEYKYDNDYTLHVYGDNSSWAFEGNGGSPSLTYVGNSSAGVHSINTSEGTITYDSNKGMYYWNDHPVGSNLDPYDLIEVQQQYGNKKGGNSSSGNDGTTTYVGSSNSAGVTTSGGSGSVGAPGTFESLIPVWGSARAAINDLQTGHWIAGSFNTAMAVSDLFLVKSIATVGVKGLWKLGAMAVENAEKSSALRGAQAVGQAAKQGAEAAERGVWSMNPLERGRVIEDAMGSNLPKNFPTIDRFSNGVATSIKSLDLSAASYQNAAALTRTVNRYIDSIAAFSGRTWAGATVDGSQIVTRQLQLVVPSVGSATQEAALATAVQRAQEMGVQLVITRFP
jgi:RHS repeat-associated protein